jgi:hypothetical protein
MADYKGVIVDEPDPISYYRVVHRPCTSVNSAADGMGSKLREYYIKIPE